jgi:hypothetical protein
MWFKRREPIDHYVRVASMIGELNGMGVDDIRLFFFFSRFRSIPRREDACLLRDFLLERLPRGYRIEVWLEPDEADERRGLVLVFPPKEAPVQHVFRGPLARFIGMFDQLAYPELIAREHLLILADEGLLPEVTLDGISREPLPV